MHFKNLTAYHLACMPTLDATNLSVMLAPGAFKPCGASDALSIGWVMPRDGGNLAYGVEGQILLKLRTEKKLLPANVVNDAAEACAKAVEEQQGFKPGRKQRREIKEAVIDELLPRAFATHRDVLVWLDPVNGWLGIDTASANDSDEVIRHLLKAHHDFPISGLRTMLSPATAMTGWLSSDEAPPGFTVDQDAELQATNQSGATVKYVRHTLEVDDLRRHIVAGKQCSRLALTWTDRVSFVLTDRMTLKRIERLGGMEEAATADERFDADVLLNAGNLRGLLGDLIAALGGEVEA